MRSKGKLTGFLFVAVCALFLAGLVHLFILRIQLGDVRPEYSTFRADPLGIRAFYYALREQPGVVVSRNLGPISRLPKGRSATLFLCGMFADRVHEDDAGAFENFAANGGRLMITFFPEAWESWEEWPGSADEIEERRERDEARPPQKGEQEDGAKGESNEKEESERRKWRAKAKREREFWAGKWVSLESRWGFAFGFKRLPGTTPDQIGSTRVQKKAGSDDLPARLSWHSTLWFDKCDPEWRVVYSRDDFPVLIERPWGSGAIILAGDSYFLSNEAVRDEPYAALLAWLAGPSTTVIFDETHLGIQESPGVVSLLRKYRLEGLVAAIVFLAGLLVWRNAVSLVPKGRASRQDGGSAAPASAGVAVVEGKGASEGLVNLLRRSVPSGKVLAVCYEEWARAFGHEPRISAHKRERIREIVKAETARPRKERNAVQAYRWICAILKERG